MTMWTNNNHNHDSSEASTTAASKRLVYGKDDMLFGCIEKTQGNKPFGNVLDAGTGMHSLRWIATLGNEEKGMTSFTAITADKTMQRNVQNEVDALEVGHLGNVIIGNWFGNTPLELPTGSFDVILADYLIGAMDGFSPYQQDLMIPKLMRLLKPGGRLYIVGLEPIPDKVEPVGDETTAGANIICQVRRVRDACILLAGHRCYREYPLEWIQRQIQQTKYNPDPNARDQGDGRNGEHLSLISSNTFSILYKHTSIVTQINVGRSKFKYFPSPALADSMKKVLDDLEKQSLDATSKANTSTSGGRIKLGFDYVVAAEKVVVSKNGMHGAEREEEAEQAPDVETS